MHFSKGRLNPSPSHNNNEREGDISRKKAFFAVVCRAISRTNIITMTGRDAIAGCIHTHRLDRFGNGSRCAHRKAILL